MVDIQLQIQNIINIADAANNQLVNIETTLLKQEKLIEHKLVETFTVYS